MGRSGMAVACGWWRDQVEYRLAQGAEADAASNTHLSQRVVSNIVLVAPAQMLGGLAQRREAYTLGITERAGSMRRAAKVDANQSAIVDALRRIGVQVEPIGKPVDLLVCHRGVTSLMEVKNPDGKDTLTKDQVEFMARWPGAVFVVRSVDDAMRAVLGEKVMA